MEFLLVPILPPPQKNTFSTKNAWLSLPSESLLTLLEKGIATCISRVRDWEKNESKHYDNNHFASPSKSL